MKFTILSHAGMLVEHDNVRLVIDPWLRSSCYWRSWWNFPEPASALIENLNPDFVYLTHLHWDHFHGPSLRRFNRKTKMLTPLGVTRRMVDDLKYLGFDDITEVPSGSSVRLGPDFVLTSYIFGLQLDSAVVIEGGNTTLLNANDCKIFGLPLDHLLTRHRPIDFVFRSHSSATAMPYCIEGYKDRFPNLRTASDYEDEFARFAIHCGARYAIPFASNHCFLHKDTRHFNDTAVVPEAAATRCNDLAHESRAPTRSVVMAPGSSWSEWSGFSLTEFDYSARDKYIESLSAKYQDVLSRQYDREAKASADFDAFSRYFSALRAATPQFLRRRIGPFAFKVSDAKGTRYWCVDMANSAVTEMPSAGGSRFVIETPAVVLNDCTQKKMFSVWAASKRLKVTLETEPARRSLGLLFTVLDAFELDLLPLTNNLKLRSLGVYLRRWREGLEASRIAFKTFVLRQPFLYGELYKVPTSQT